MDIDSLDMIGILQEKIAEIQGFYANDRAENFQPDDNPTTEERSYDISVSLKSKPNGKIRFRFIDCPGEWIKNKDHMGDIERLVKTSSVYIIAIDMIKQCFVCRFMCFGWLK